MAPGTIRAEAVDGRCDIFALGAVTYEMLTARPAFAGASAADIASAVLLKDPPPLSEVRPEVPPALSRLVERCLAKASAARFQSASDLAFALDTIGAVSGSGTHPAQDVQPAGWLSRRWALAAGLAAVALLVVAGLASRRPEPVDTAVPAPKRLSLNPPDGMRFVHGQMPMLSPDGTKVAANLRGPDGRLSSWVMDLTSGDARELADAAGGARWFWKPDSSMVGFFSEGHLRVAGPTGGTATSVADIGGVQGFGAAWNDRDTILFAPSDTGLWAANASGGARRLTSPGALSAIGEWWPAFLAGGERFVTFVEVDDEKSGLSVGSLTAPTPGWLLPTAGRGVVSGDYVLFPRDGTLFAQRLESATAALAGPATNLGLSVAVNPNGLNTLVSASQRGELLIGSEELMQARLVWFDRSGREHGEVGPPRAFRNAVLSPDGTAVLEDRRDTRSGRHQVWRLDVGRRSETLLYEPAYAPQWSPDGSRIAFSISRSKPTGIAVANANGTGMPERLHSEPTGLPPSSDWSSDGRMLAFATRSGSDSDDVKVLSLADRTVGVAAGTRANEFDGTFSPDNQWIAYWSDESGQRQIYVKHLGSGARRQVSTTGGATPRWRADGRELFFLAPDGTMMSVAVTPGPELRLSEPRPLFATGADAISRLGVGSAFDVTADGQRFLVRVPVALTGRSPITVILNWQSMLAGRSPAP